MSIRNWTADSVALAPSGSNTGQNHWGTVGTVIAVVVVVVIVVGWFLRGRRR